MQQLHVHAVAAGHEQMDRLSGTDRSAARVTPGALRYHPLARIKDIKGLRL